MHDLALADALAIVLAVAGGVGDQTGGYLVGSSHHVDGVGLGIHRGVKVQQRGNAHGHSASGQHHHLTVRQLLCLLGSHNDVLVVGQHEHGLGGNTLDGCQNVLGGGFMV